MSAEKNSPDEDRFCFAWPAPRPILEGAERQALQKKTQWAPGQIVEVAFLDGDRSLQERVAAAAKLWTVLGLANLRFVFRYDTTSTPIRISFRHSGSWSLLGTDCLTIKDITQPTMNFGWLRSSSSDEDVRSVVLHEFGHALGLIHEHQVPKGGIQWNKQKVYRDLSGPPNSWSVATIDQNIFRAFSAGETNFATMDPRSIMMYPFPASWTLDGFTTGINRELSDADKQFIRKQYP